MKRRDEKKKREGARRHAEGRRGYRPRKYRAAARRSRSAVEISARLNVAHPNMHVRECMRGKGFCTGGNGTNVSRVARAHFGTNGVVLLTSLDYITGSREITESLTCARPGTRLNFPSDISRRHE